MSAAGADWLTRPERIQEEDPDGMLASLDIQKGSVVADVGAGVGYHVWRLSEIVGPAGKVIAEDIQEEMLRLLKKNIDDRKLMNVEMILGTPTDPKLPANAGKISPIRADLRPPQDRMSAACGFATRSAQR